MKEPDKPKNLKLVASKAAKEAILKELYRPKLFTEKIEIKLAENIVKDENYVQ
ncbi:MAG TPA: hypothetical protein VK175_08035 [Leadbetterella sp.]|nr:hypothetical protein [Leadbetterella sp.]